MSLSRGQGELNLTQHWDCWGQEWAVGLDRVHYLRSQTLGLSTQLWAKLYLISPGTLGPGLG